MVKGVPSRYVKKKKNSEHEAEVLGSFVIVRDTHLVMRCRVLRPFFFRPSRRPSLPQSSPQSQASFRSSLAVSVQKLGRITCARDTFIFKTYLWDSCIDFAMAEDADAESPFFAKASKARRKELQDAKNLKDDALIDSPALKQMRDAATARYQQVTDAHTRAKIEADQERVKAALTASIAAVSMTPVSAPPSDSSRTRKQTAPHASDGDQAEAQPKARAPSAGGGKRSLSTRAGTPTTVSEVLASLVDVVAASWTKLYQQDAAGAGADRKQSGLKFPNMISASKCKGGKSLTVWVQEGTQLTCTVCNSKKDMGVSRGHLSCFCGRALILCQVSTAARLRQFIREHNSTPTHHVS